MAGNDGGGFVPLDALTVLSAGPVDVQVKDRYDDLARTGASTLCCAPQEVYSADDLAGIPQWVLDLSSGCGSPVTSLPLRTGQTVVDLGCGAGLDLLLAARRVGPTGKVIGVDASPSMVATARRAAAESGITNVEVRVGDIRRPPVRPGTADVLISNCVLGMFEDKGKVLAAAASIVKPGGYAIVSDVVYVGDTPPEAVVDQDGADGDDFSRCVVGLTADAYRRLVLDAGFARVEITDDGIVNYRDGAAVTSASITAYTSADADGQACC